jgi:hypothetical protein
MNKGALDLLTSVVRPTAGTRMFPDQRRVYRHGTWATLNTSHRGACYPLSLVMAGGTHIYQLPTASDLGAPLQSHIRSFLVRAHALLTGQPHRPLAYQRRAYADPAQVAPGGGTVHATYGPHGVALVEYSFEVIAREGSRLVVAWEPSGEDGPSNTPSRGAAEVVGYGSQ